MFLQIAAQRLGQPLRRMVETLARLREQAVRRAAARAPAAPDGGGGRSMPLVKQRSSAALEIQRLRQQFGAHRHRHFGRGGRRRRAACRTAKSISVVSVSCPTAEISGIALAAAARTTISSLKAIRSSTEPPPRATMIRSGRGRCAAAERVEAARWRRRPRPAAFSPCTATGHSSTRRGKRACSRCMMSRITAPVGEVTTPITSGRNGSVFLRAASNRPSAASVFLRSSSSAISAPRPASSTCSTMIW